MNLDNKNLNEELVEKISEARNEPKWLFKNRLEAFKRFKELDKPKFKYGLSITLDVSDLDFSKLDFTQLEKPLDYDLPEHGEIEIMDISKALGEKQELIKQYFSEFNFNDNFDAMNSAFFNHGYFVYVPKNVQVEKPLQINTLMRKLQISKTIIALEENSKLDLINGITSEGGYGFRNEAIEGFTKSNAKLNYADIQNLSHDVYNFSRKLGKADKDSVINWLACCLGSKFTRDTVYTELIGRGANTNNYGFFFGTKDQQFDLSAKSRHLAPNTVCDMATKGVVDDKSKAIYQGLVRIEPNAPNSNGYQKEDVLILSEEAEADSIPQLEIGNNDVKCSHGATVGQVDREKIFYLQTRGLDEETAEKKIIEGFFEPMIEKVHMKDLREDIRKVIIARMEK